MVCRRTANVWRHRDFHALDSAARVGRAEVGAERVRAARLDPRTKITKLGSRARQEPSAREKVTEEGVCAGSSASTTVRAEGPKTAVGGERPCGRSGVVGVPCEQEWPHHGNIRQITAAYCRGGAPVNWSRTPTRSSVTRPGMPLVRLPAPVKRHDALACRPRRRPSWPS